MKPTDSPHLNRSLGRLDMVALGINGVVGSGIFFLPSRGDELMGPAALFATAGAGLLCLLIALCFAEVASHFDQTGGPYLYAREAFGNFAGFQVGWMTFWVGVISWAALANAAVMAATHFYPALANGPAHTAAILSVMIGLSWINHRGVKWGAWACNIFTVGKMLPLFLFVCVGAFFIEPGRFEPLAPKGYGNLGEATLIILYAYVGFEGLAVPAGEMKNPRRSLPIALLMVISIATVLYLAIQFVATGTIDELAGHQNPLAAAAAGFMGERGGQLIALGSVISVLGVNAGGALIYPRRLYAMAEQGDMPKVFARLHPVYHTPTPAIVASAALAAALALSGTYIELALLSVVARFIQYIPTCIAVFVFRRRAGKDHDGFRAPLGGVIPVLACLLSTGLLTQAGHDKLLAGLIAMALGVPFYVYNKASHKSTRTT